ncbi:hypothetical protein IH992_16120 [Candidatus Poribacteria bacterium]|nr:hypothetical protein [Candidatus Poribacteria bacterium]
MMEKASTILGQKFTLNDLRHTFATQLYQKSEDLESVRVALGLSRFKLQQIAMYTNSSESGVSSGKRPHVESDNDVEIIQPKQGVWRTYDITDELPAAGVACLHEDRHGYLWLGTVGGGLYRYDGAEFVTYTTADGLADNRISFKICEDRQGRLWIGTEGSGVSCFDGRRPQGSQLRTYTTVDGLASNHVRAICEDRQGRLWFGTGGMGGGVSYFDGERFNTYTTADGLADNSVISIYLRRPSRAAVVWNLGWVALMGVGCPAMMVGDHRGRSYRITR